jgi:AGZA family xanthine/uracil permease-like MFS transporter
VAAEVRGGIATFLLASWIPVVNPQILAAWTKGRAGELDYDSTSSEYFSDIATATALTCALGCVLVGLLANLPFAVGPGMGINNMVAGMFVSVCMEGQACNVDRATQFFRLGLTTCFVAGALMLAFALINGPKLVALAMPSTLQTAIMVGMGAFQAFVGLRWMHVIVPGSAASLLSLEGGLDFNWSDANEDYIARLRLFSCSVRSS